MMVSFLMSSWLVLLCFFLLELSESSFLRVLSTSLLRARKVRERRSTSTANIYNEEGDIDQLRNADIAIGHSSPIVIIQCQNGTLVSYLNTTNPAQVSSKNLTTTHENIHSKLRLRVVGADFVTPLMDPQLCLVVTGLAADCAMTISHALQYVVNATHAYGSSPPGKLIAKSIADLFLKATVGSDRPFACHAFLCDMRRKETLSDNHEASSCYSNFTVSNQREGVIFEVEPNGSMRQVYASVVGAGAGALTTSKGKTSGYDILEAEFDSRHCDLDSAKLSATKVLQHCFENSWLSESESKDDEAEQGNTMTKVPSVQITHELIPY